MTWAVVSLVFGLIALSRVPFLDSGYGVNVDAWRVARVARSIAETGEYEVSRFPGYPVQEIVNSWFWKGGPFALNALSAFMSLLACLGVWQVARKLHCRDVFFLIGALAFTPLFFVSSVTSKDYVWALAFAWLAMWLAVENKPLFSGVLLGLAIGCRITTAAMLLPLALILIGQNRGSARRRALSALAIASALASVICFLPVWGRYRWDFFRFYESHARPDVPTILLRGTWEVWGALGLLGLVISLGGTLLQLHRSRPTSIPPPSNRMIVPALCCVVAVYAAAFMRLPDQAGYLLPIVPATLLLLACFAPRPCFQICCALLIVAPFFDVSRDGLQAGAILQDHREREQTMSDVTRFVQFTEVELSGENLVVVGAWEPMIAVLAPPGTVRNHYVYLATEAEVRSAIAAGWGLAYSGPPVRQFNYSINGVDLATFGAQDLRQLLRATHPGLSEGREQAPEQKGERR